MNKQRNPDVDWGFHATIPRVVRTEYKDLTPVQKWLYVCLKDLCGDYATCYRTLRVLAEETGISTGMLSESIRKLHEAGLIHAEKKKRFNTSSKEVWHITIVDIWSANAKAHPTKRSQNEHSQENVHTVNNNVQQMNDEAVECSADEQKRSLCETEVITLSNNNIEAITDKNTDVNASALTPTHSSENENETHYPQSNTSSPQDIHSEPQASTDIPIAKPTAQTDALVGVATRNTESLVEPPQAETPTRRRGSRKPKVKTAEDESMEQRITNVFDCLDKLASEYAGEEFHYPQFKTDKDAVKTLLTSWKDLNPKQVSAVYRFMMDSPKSKSGWLWSDHMSVKAFCNNFAAEYAKMIGNSNGHANKDTNTTSAAVAAGYTDYTNTPPTNYKPLPRKRV